MGHSNTARLFIFLCCMLQWILRQNSSQTQTFVGIRQLQNGLFNQFCKNCVCFQPQAWINCEGTVDKKTLHVVTRRCTVNRGQATRDVWTVSWGSGNSIFWGWEADTCSSEADNREADSRSLPFILKWCVVCYSTFWLVASPQKFCILLIALNSSRLVFFILSWSFVLRTNWTLTLIAGWSFPLGLNFDCHFTSGCWMDDKIRSILQWLHSMQGSHCWNLILRYDIAFFRYPIWHPVFLPIFFFCIIMAVF